jgi:hypothetical protein
MFTDRTYPRRCTSTRSARLSLQPLEDRCTPASAFVTFTDADGDLVKVTASKPGQVAPPLTLPNLTLSGGTAGQLQTLNLTDPGFDGARITITAKKKAGGDGLVNVGYINATFRDLDRVIVKGDLAKIFCGDPATIDDPGLNLLKVRSMGTLGLTTGAPDLGSSVIGKLGVLKVARDFVDARMHAIGGVDGQIGSVFVGGDVIGGAGMDSGQIRSDGAMGKVRIGGDIVGGAGMGSGRIRSGDAMGNLRIGGDVVGGAGQESGGISAKSVGKVRIGGDVLGGDGMFTGFVNSGGTMGILRIGGGVVGGAGQFSGVVGANYALGNVRIGGNVAGGSVSVSGLIFGGTLGNVRIGGDLIGGSVDGAASVADSGLVRSNSSIASVTIRGSLIAGTDNSAGTLDRSGAIVAVDDIGPIKIRGNILGNSTNAALISARGQKVKPLTGYDVALARLTVKGNVTFAEILAGFDPLRQPVNADASIGDVRIGGHWKGSSIVAGAENLGADDMVGGLGVNADNVNFGDGHDFLQTMADTALIARIKSIVIGGHVAGSPIAGDHFGFVAQQIDKLKIAGQSVSMVPGPSNNIVIIPSTTDVQLLEVS